jgi:hypothetical protein
MKVRFMKGILSLFLVLSLVIAGCSSGSTTKKDGTESLLPTKAELSSIGLTMSENGPHTIKGNSNVLYSEFTSCLYFVNDKSKGFTSITVDINNFASNENLETVYSRLMDNDIMKIISQNEFGERGATFFYGDEKDGFYKIVFVKKTYVVNMQIDGLNIDKGKEVARAIENKIY